MDDLIERIHEYIEHWPNPCEVAVHILRDAIGELERHRWIPVAERLPGHEDDVDVVVEYFIKAAGIVVVGFYADGWYDEDEVALRCVTHWRERPEPPKGDA